MHTSTPLPRDLRVRLRRHARAFLATALDALVPARAAGHTVRSAVVGLTAAPLTDLPTSASWRVHQALRRLPARSLTHPAWRRIRRRLPELWRALRTEPPAESLDSRQDRFVRQAIFAAAVAVPLLARGGRYDLAVRLVEGFRRTAASPAYRDVRGAGGGGEDGRLRFLMLAPLFWSLAAFRPIPVTEKED